MKQPRAILVGCGGISRAWLGSEAIRKKVTIVGLVDLQQEVAEARKAEFALAQARTGTDLAALLKQTDPTIVFDCTVPEAHCAVTLSALRHGCHVFGEKPMSDSMPAARRMLTAARKANRTYAVMQNRRYLAGIRALKRFLDSGRIGPIVAVHSDFFMGIHFGGFRDIMDHVLLLDMAIHTFDQARFITGTDAASVYCHEWTPRGSWYRSGPSAAAIFEMTGGVVYTYRGSWCAEGCPTSWEASWRIIGETGTLLWNGGPDFRCERVKGTAGVTRPVRPLKVPLAGNRRLAKGHQSAIDMFLTAIAKGTAPETEAADNIKSLAMVHGAVKSATTGRKVNL